MNFHITFFPSVFVNYALNWENVSPKFFSIGITSLNNVERAKKVWKFP